MQLTSDLYLVGPLLLASGGRFNSEALPEGAKVACSSDYAFFAEVSSPERYWLGNTDSPRCRARPTEQRVLP